jgi:hypothetical protein
MEAPGQGSNGLGHYKAERLNVVRKKPCCRRSRKWLKTKQPQVPIFIRNKQMIVGGIGQQVAV